MSVELSSLFCLRPLALPELILCAALILTPSGSHPSSGAQVGGRGCCAGKDHQAVSGRLQGSVERQACCVLSSLFAGKYLVFFFYPLDLFVYRLR